MPDQTEFSAKPGDEAALPEGAGGETAAATAGVTSVLGLGLVSAINLGCVVFIAYHFATQGDPPAAVTDIKLRAGNVTLEPAPAIVLAVASHIDASPLEEPPVEETLPPAAMQVRAMVVASPAPPPSAPVTPEAASVRAQPANEIEAGGRPAPEHGPAYWVQLGAMSGMDTARSFWATLRTRHGGLLGPHQPSILGPDQFGGRLYHLRVGPLPSNAATDLCSGLQQAGGDCFRVAAASEPAGHAVQEGSAPALPRIGEAAQSRRSAVVPASSSH